MSQIQSNRLTLAALMTGIAVLAMLMTAISFEFFAEEMAKVFVVPLLLTAVIIQAVVVGSMFYVRSLT